MTKPKGEGGSFVRILHETLGSLAAPEVRDELMRRALSMATSTELPNDAHGYANFVRGPLRSVMLHKLGAEATDSIALELEHVVRISSAPSTAGMGTTLEFEVPKLDNLSELMGDIDEFDPTAAALESAESAGARIAALHLNKLPSTAPGPISESYPESCERMSSKRPTSQAYERGISSALGMGRAATSQDLAPRIFVASQSQTFVHGLAHFLEPEAIPVSDVMELLKRLSDAPNARSVIVLDCRRPSIRPIALAALADELPRNVQVVLWGASKGLRYQLARLSPSASSWFNCSEDDDLQSVALRCENLVG